MHTEEDLRATLSALEHEAPDPVGVLAVLARARRQRTVRRRVVGVVAVATAVAVVAGGSVLVGNLAGPSGRTAMQTAGHFNPLRYPFAVDESSGLRVAYGSSRFAGAASASIGDNALIAGLYPYHLEVIEGGGWVPPAGQAGEPVKVNGMTGFYRADFQYRHDKGVPGVAWEYAPDAWAVLRYRPTEPDLVPPADVRQTLLRVAAAVRFDRTTPVRLPFQVGYLPAGLHPADDFLADMNSIPDITSPSVPVTTSTSAAVTLVDGTKSIVIRLARIAVRFDGATIPRGDLGVYETPNGIPFVTTNLGQFGVQVSGKQFSVDELKKVARSITAATNLYDPHTWFVAEKALPLR